MRVVYSWNCYRITEARKCYRVMRFLFDNVGVFYWLAFLLLFFWIGNLFTKLLLILKVHLLKSRHLTHQIILIDNLILKTHRIQHNDSIGEILSPEPRSRITEQDLINPRNLHDSDNPARALPNVHLIKVNEHKFLVLLMLLHF